MEKTPFDNLKEIVDKVGGILRLEPWIIEKLKTPDHPLPRDFKVTMDDGKIQDFTV